MSRLSNFPWQVMMFTHSTASPLLSTLKKLPEGIYLKTGKPRKPSPRRYSPNCETPSYFMTDRRCSPMVATAFSTPRSPTNPGIRIVSLGAVYFLSFCGRSNPLAQQNVAKLTQPPKQDWNCRQSAGRHQQGETNVRLRHRIYPLPSGGGSLRAGHLVRSFGALYHRRESRCYPSRSGRRLCPYRATKSTSLTMRDTRSPQANSARSR